VEATESESSEEEASKKKQPIYLSLFLGDEIGTKVLKGTTASDPAKLSREFCRKEKIPEELIKGVQKLIQEKQRQMMDQV
jgi:hypothetical protein